MSARDLVPPSGLARRRLALALLGTYVFQVLGAALLALPAVQAVSASGVTQFPEGDGKLLESGGLFLIEVFMHERQAAFVALPATLLLALLISLIGMVPEWLVVRALGPSAPNVRRTLTSCVSLGMLTWAARVALGLATLLLAMTARSYVAGMRDERAPFFAFAVATLLGLGAQACVSVVRDVAVSSAIVHGTGARQAIASTLGSLQRRGLRWLVRYIPFTLTGLGVALGGALGASKLDVSWPGAWLTAVLLHQVAVALTIALRAAWLATLRRDVGDIADRTVGHAPSEAPRPQADAFL
jgi:hypothetical protein